MRLDRPGRFVSVVGLLLATAACGSTVQVRGSLDTPSARDAGLAVPESNATLSPGASVVHGQTGTTDLGPAAGGSPGVPGGTSAGGTASPSAGGGRQPPVGSGPPPRTTGFGFTRTVLRIGVAYDSTFSQQLGSAGVSAGSAAVGDQKQQVQALVADLNRRGGIAGRKVVPIFYDTKGTSSQNDSNTLAQGACTYWTQDNQVWAAMTYVVQMDNTTLYQCLAKRHVVFIPFAGESTAAFKRFSPFLWSPAGVTPEQVAPTWIARLGALGYFGGWNTATGAPAKTQPVIGLLYGSGYRNNQSELDTSFRAAVKKALATRGLSVTKEAQVGNNQADEASAVLQFQQAGVTHVVGDYSVVNFTQSAESQRYRPRYALSSFTGGVAMKLFAPPTQLKGAVGIGWVPPGDVESDRDPGTPAQGQCRKIMRDAQQGTDVRLAWFAMTWACDTFSWLARVAPLSGLDPYSLPRVAAKLGTVSGAFTFKMAFPRGEYSGAAVARDYAYDEGCSCFTYTGTVEYAL